MMSLSSRLHVFYAIFHKKIHYFMYILHKTMNIPKNIHLQFDKLGGERNIFSDIFARPKSLSLT